MPVERVRDAVAAPCQRLMIETTGNSVSITLRCYLACVDKRKSEWRIHT